jgi:hypothetical protein
MAGQTFKVSELLQRGLRETEQSAADLAEAVQVPHEYMADLVAGRRRPPRPERTDLYEGITSFLRLGRNELSGCASAELAVTALPRGSGPPAKVRRALLELCEPATAQKLERDRTKQGSARLTDLIQRLTDVAQRAVRRKLSDQVTLRIAARQGGSTYVAMRFRVLEFLDATADTLTHDHVTGFIQPLVGFWDADIETGVLRVVMRPNDNQERQHR